MAEIPSVEKINYKGWDAVALKNDWVSLVAVPDIGGRVMAYDLGPYSYLYNDPSLLGRLFSSEENQGDGSLRAWKNYGGDKTWPSPQGWENEDQWPGPPDALLDSGRYASQMGTDAGSAWVRMTSPTGSTTGIQIARQVTLRPGSSRVQLDLTFTNISQRQVRWSIWDVIQLDAGRRLPDGAADFEPACSVTTPLNPNSRYPRGFSVMFGDEHNPQWTAEIEKGLFVGNYLWEIGKVGVDSKAGWAAFSNAARGYALAERFSYEPEVEYPDAGATVEFWTVGRGKVANLDYEGSGIYLMEAEVLSPFYTFAAGQSRTHTIEWGACRCPGKVVAVNAAGCTAEPLSAEPLGDGYVRLKGAFGLFDQGALYLTWKDASGAVIQSSERGQVDPMGALLIDRSMRVPEQAGSVALEVVARVSGEMQLLAETAL
jgi:hypothetical protein